MMPQWLASVGIAISSVLLSAACAQETPEQRSVRAGVEACGIAEAQLTLGYDASLQQKFVRVATGGAPTDAQLDCIVRTIDDTRYSAFFDDEAVADRFAKRLFAVNAAAKKPEAEAWLRVHGLLDRLPKFDPTGRKDTIAPLVASYCGIEPANTLRSVQDGLTALASALSADQARCVTSTLVASGLVERGISLTLIVKP